VEDDRMDEGLGGSFWLKVFGVLALGAVAALLIWLLFEAAWLRWGFLGAFALFAVVLLAIAYMFDRRSQQRYEDLSS
jgi:membrane protein implicated in regulation of membrane protease activity